MPSTAVHVSCRVGNDIPTIYDTTVRWAEAQPRRLGHKCLIQVVTTNVTEH